MINDPDRLKDAVDRAMQESFSKSVIVEEFIHGSEYSVEMISWKGEHHFLAITEKVTTGQPYFVEIEQHEPAPVSPEPADKIISLVLNALSALGVQNGASHSEVMVDDSGLPHIIEIGARMGGDNIGAYLVELSTGYDFVKGVIEVALGTEPKILKKETRHAGIYYLTPAEGTVHDIELHTSEYIELKHYEVFVKPGDRVEYPVKDSAQRSGYFIYQSEQPYRLNSPDEIINIITSP
jgi:biotin carboxylase